MRVTLCQKYNVQYAYTTLPNMFGQRDQSDINDKLTSYYLIMLGIKCYTLLPLYLCSQFAPKCNSTGHLVPPCKSLCKGKSIRFASFAQSISLEQKPNIDVISFWTYSILSGQPI